MIQDEVEIHKKHQCGSDKFEAARRFKEGKIWEYKEIRTRNFAPKHESFLRELEIFRSSDIARY